MAVTTFTLCVRLQCLLAVHDDLVAVVEAVEDLAAPVQRRDADLHRPERDASLVDPPHAVLPVDALHSGRGHRADVGEFGDADRHLDQFADRDAFRPGGESDVDDPFLGDGIAHQVDALHLPAVGALRVGAQHDLGRLAHANSSGLRPGRCAP